MERNLIKRLGELYEEEEIFLRNLEADVKRNEKNPDFTISGSRVHKGKHDITLHIHSRYEPFPLHKHDFVEIMTVVSGEITHHIDGVTIPLSEGDVLLMNKHISHSIDSTGENDVGINFIISDSFLGAVAPDLADTVFADFVRENSKPKGEAAYLHFRTEGQRQIGNLIENLCYELTNDEFDHTVLTETLSLLLRYLSLGREDLLAGGGVTDKNESRKMKIASYVSGNYRNATLSGLAEATYLSQPYLSRLVKQLFGCSFKELVVEERMRRAEELITKTDMPISTVTESVGYENDSYFHREYKQRFGKTPLQTRKARS